MACERSGVMMGDFNHPVGLHYSPRSEHPLYEWLASEEASGKYMRLIHHPCDGPTRFTFYFSDADTALNFKMRFA